MNYEIEFISRDVWLGCNQIHQILVLACSQQVILANPDVLDNE